jgi:hypothetical protein
MRLFRRQPALQLDVDPPVAWRERRLRDAGFSDELAARLAEDPAYDLHALLELVDRGCPADLAARIVAPIEDDSDAC